MLGTTLGIEPENQAAAIGLGHMAIGEISHEIVGRMIARPKETNRPETLDHKTGTVKA